VPVVDVRRVLSLVGAVLRYLSFAFLLPLVVALLYGESIAPYVVAFFATYAVATVLARLTPSHEEVGWREGFLVVTLTWLAVAAFGAIPYLVVSEPQLHHPVDAYFESMSGFTTTGATVLTDIEAMPRALLLWRSFTQWLGGLGIVVLALAILPRLAVGGQQLMDAEMPGTGVEKLTPRIRETARRLWLLYTALTATELLVLWALGLAGAPNMDLYTAAATTFSTMSCGGFSPEARSIEAFGGAVQVVVMCFMVLAGLNIALVYRSLQRRSTDLLRDDQTRLYFGLLVAAGLLLTVELWASGTYGSADAIRHGAFQGASMLTGTAFSSADFAAWTPLALATLVTLMFFGGCTGSTTGGIKQLRILLMARAVRRELMLTIDPPAVVPVRLNGRAVDELVIRSVFVFFAVYVGVFAAGTLALLIDASRVGQDLNAFEAISAAAASIGNVGPGVGFLGPLGSYESLSAPSKLVTLALMWIGRLEILPVVIVLSRAYWRP
jgi:trk system potassium uptake protein